MSPAKFRRAMSSPTASPQRHRSPTCFPRAPAGTLPARPPPRCRTPPRQPPLPTRALTFMQGMTEPVPGARPRSCHRRDRAAPARRRAEPPRSRPGSCGSAEAGGERAAGSDDPTASTCPAAASPTPGRRVKDCDSALSSGMALLSPFPSVLCSGDRGLTGSFQSSDLSQ